MPKPSLLLYPCQRQVVGGTDCSDEDMLDELVTDAGDYHPARPEKTTVVFRCCLERCLLKVGRKLTPTQG